MGHKVVSIEPFYDNIIRIHKAARLENTFKNIILITNAISNKRNEIKLLQKSVDNIGGQSLLPNEDKTFNKDENNKYLVETILFDDIVPHLPSGFRHALIKIDIEGFEPYAFENADILFEVLDVRVVFMEWGNKKGVQNARTLAMLDFLYKRNYTPYHGDKLLDRKKTQTWPWDILWKK